MRATAIVLLLAAALSSAAAQAQLFVNLHGATLDHAGRLQRFEAMLVGDDSEIVAIGTRASIAADPEAAPWLGNADLVDCGGRYLLPGLIDAHGHLNNLGKLRIQANLIGSASLAEASARIRAYAAAHPDSPWLLGRGWNEQLWPDKRLPTAADLDAIVADRPAWFRRVDGHAGWANHAALAAAGITRDSPDPSGGRIERDAQGEPTGVLVDAALDLLESFIPSLTPAQLATALDAAQAELVSVGLTSVGDLGIDRARYELYKRYAADGMLKLRVYAFIDGVGADFDAIAADRKAAFDDGLGMLEVRAVKLYADGALGSRGAALLAPYSDAPTSRGTLFETPPALRAKIEKALAQGYQVGVHAIGDGANREVLDAFEAIYREHPGYRALRNRIEHAQVVAPEDIPRFKALDLVASMQPTHATSDMHMAGARIGEERLAGAYAWRRYLAQGTRIAAGSDFPVESTNPFWGIHAAVTRQDHDNHPPGGWRPQERMSVPEALRAFTLDAAYAMHMEDRVGTLEPGMQADFILVDQDIFQMPPERLWQVRVLETWVAGERVYRAEAAPEAQRE
jgi:predicted amidohydrolase YtcJ